MQKNSIRIPAFITSPFSETHGKEDKEVFLQEYKRWVNSEFTEHLTNHLHKLLKHKIQEDEDKTSFASLFESKYSRAHSLGYRKALRELIKQLGE